MRPQLDLVLKKRDKIYEELSQYLQLKNVLEMMKEPSIEEETEKATIELVSTEVTYSRLLGLLIQWYVKPLSDYKLISNDKYRNQGVLE